MFDLQVINPTAIFNFNGFRLASGFEDKGSQLGIGFPRRRDENTSLSSDDLNGPIQRRLKTGIEHPHPMVGKNQSSCKRQIHAGRFPSRRVGQY